MRALQAPWATALLAERQAPRLARLPATIERLDGRLRLWPAAGHVLLALVSWLGGGFLNQR